MKNIKYLNDCEISVLGLVKIYGGRNLGSAKLGTDSSVDLNCSDVNCASQNNCSKDGCTNSGNCVQGCGGIR